MTNENKTQTKPPKTLPDKLRYALKVFGMLMLISSAYLILGAGLIFMVGFGVCKALGVV